MLPATMTNYLPKFLDKLIWKLIEKISKLWTIRLESDVREVVNVVVRDGLSEVRDALTRCPYIILAINIMENESGDIFTQPGGRGEN